MAPHVKQRPGPFHGGFRAPAVVQLQLWKSYRIRRHLARDETPPGQRPPGKTTQNNTGRIKKYENLMLRLGQTAAVQRRPRPAGTPEQHAPPRCLQTAKPEIHGPDRRGTQLRLRQQRKVLVRFWSVQRPGNRHPSGTTASFRTTATPSRTTTLS